jgi:hypothetical protein
MMTAPVMDGSLVVGKIVFTPLPAMLKFIVSAPAAALASSIACRRLPAPLSLVLVTTNVAALRLPLSTSATTRLRVSFFNFDYLFTATPSLS